MQPATSLYPSSPKNVPSAITNPGSEYKKHVGKVMFSVILFFVVYMILVVLSVVLSIFCVYAGIALMAASGHWIGILAGLGIISIGIMVFIFLIKFIFSVKKFDESKTIRCTEDQYPQLFDFIRRLTKDTQTDFPRKIVLSTDVNACVYYNDSFWSMFFPVRKNLQIGLGLVNSLTLSEFKAVMAHEFGHFSQKSMKLGSFVYNVNKVIYNMLYENKDYGKFLSGFGSIHAVIYIFVWITVQIVSVIQKILQWMYGFINKSYMRLSREMEFHADAVAASVSGSGHCIAALRKIELSSQCFNTVLQKADAYLQQKEVFENIYSKHNVVMRQYAAEFNLPLKNNIPVTTDEFLKRFQLSKVNIQDQWASHPSTADRVIKLQQLSVEAVTDDQPAWVLFSNAGSLQQQLTAVLYDHLPADVKQTIIPETVFEERYLTEAATYRLPGLYNAYYDGRQVEEMDMDSICAAPVQEVLNETSMKLLFSDQAAAWPGQLAAMESDAGIIEAVMKKQVDIKSFEYDGVKYKRGEASAVLQTVKAQIEKLRQQIQQHDKHIFSFFYSLALTAGADRAGELKEKYRHYFELRKRTGEFALLYQKVYEILTPLLQGQTIAIDAAKRMGQDLWEESVRMKPFLREFLQKGMISSGESMVEIKRFIDASFQYFWTDAFIDSDLLSLRKTIAITVNETGDYQFKIFRQLLEYQLQLLEAAPVTLRNADY